ncbi:hypothetical protein [Pseudomonas fulva]|uniref:nSTAND3 domain-containing NTPase n=1 Tax=Pseudomonas fulva TaxID=47880 RepID=UPI001E60E4A1|nr:hypothetical protein [Pseudomonas fulva]
MNDYDFSPLNDKEFEVLCADLIGAANGVRFERFKAGRDGGVDGRYYTPAGTEWILQAKHRPGSSLSKIASLLRDTEAPNVAALKPARYILAVSHKLSRLNKEQLASALGAGCPVEVFGREDLNDLLARNPDIERRHFKLWISSSTVLQTLLNNAINGRSDAMMKDIIEKSRMFASTHNFDWTVDKLNQLGTVIITGQPGIGKTTLAEQLILRYASEGYELLCISQFIHEAEQAYEPDRLQLFYFDDFLGQNYLQALNGHEGSHIVRFIKRVHRERATKKFVLTSRSTILNQGRIRNDVFEHNNIDRNEMEIRLESLSSLDKAHILYNHLWHSGHAAEPLSDEISKPLEAAQQENTGTCAAIALAKTDAELVLSLEHIDQLYEGKRYWQVINHPNFNPRIIQFITDPQRIIDVPAAGYWKYVRDSLSNPAKIWAHPFDAQLDDFGRFMVLLVAFSDRTILEAELLAAYAAGIAMPGNASFSGRRDYSVTIRHVSNSLLTRIVLQDKAIFKLFNPSLGDFLISRYATSLNSIELVFKSLRSLSALVVLLNMAKNGLIDQSSKSRLLMSLLEHEESLQFNGSQPEYLAKLYLEATIANPGLSVIRIHSSCEANIARLKNVIQAILTAPAVSPCLSCLRLTQWAVSLSIVTLSELLAFTMKTINFGIGSEELPILGDLVATLEANDIDTASEPFTSFAHTYICDALDDMFEDDHVFANSESSWDARRQLERMITEKFNSWQIEPSDAMIDEIVDAFDISERMRHYFRAEDHRYISPQTAQNRSDAINVDDLFSRDR